MPRLMLVVLLALPGCGLRYVTGNGWVDVPGTNPGAGPVPVVVTIGGSAPVLCGPDDMDPPHTCPAQAGPDPR